MSCYVSLGVAELETSLALILHLDQRNFRCPGAAKERSGSPRSDQSTPSDEDEILHMLDAESYLLRPFEPADYIIPDVVLENLCADDIFTVAVVRNR